MARVAIDCDGVLANFNYAGALLANKLWPGTVPNPATFVPTEWDWISREKQTELWAAIRSTPNWWLTLPAYSDSIHDLANWLATAKHGHEIWIVTSRAPSAGLPISRQTQIWLHTAMGSLLDNVSSYVGVITVTHWHEKSKLYKDIGIQYSIDDKSETVEACDKLQNHTAYLFSQPWNLDSKAQHRVSSISEFTKGIPSE